LSVWHMNGTTLVAREVIFGSAPTAIAGDWRVGAVTDLGNDAIDILMHSRFDGTIFRWSYDVFGVVQAAAVLDLVPDTTWRLIGPR
jgi:hypothetical protein